MSVNDLIQINIDKSYTMPLMLSKLIQDELGINVDISNLSIKFILENSVNVEVIDDIISFEKLNELDGVKHDFEFVLNENSKIFYLCNLKPKFDSTYDEFILKEPVLRDLNFDKNLVFNLLGANSYAKVRIRNFAHSCQNFKFKTLQNHENENSFSCLCIKNVLCDSAKVKCENKIKVNERGSKVFANQVNRNLIIGSGAHVISIPQLEIENDDVKCRHGAATKTIDDDQLFYLQSHGIDYVCAKQMLIKGFLG